MRYRRPIRDERDAVGTRGGIIGGQNSFLKVFDARNLRGKVGRDSTNIVTEIGLRLNTLLVI